VPGSQKFYVGVFGVDGAISSHLQGLDGMFFVAKRAVVESVASDEVTFDGFHGYDLDFSFAAHLAGFSVGVSAEIAVIHASGGTFGDAGSVTPPGSPKSTATSFQPRSVAPSGRSRGCWWHRRRRSCASFRLSA